MHIWYPIKEGSRFAAEFGHEVLVDVFRTVEVPDQNGADGIERDQDGHADQGKPPHLDVVAQEDQHGRTDDGDKPDSRGVDAFRVFNGIRRWQTHGLGELDLGRQGFGHDPRAVSVKRVDQAHAVDFNKISE